MSETKEAAGLVERLRLGEGLGAAMSPSGATAKYVIAIMDEAATTLEANAREIERLTAERDDLATALEHARRPMAKDQTAGYRRVVAAIRSLKHGTPDDGR